MDLFGILTKMGVAAGTPITYTLRLGDDAVRMNDLLDRDIAIEFTGELRCRVCGQGVRKLYGEGYCWPHFQSDPGNAPCIVRPELCEAHLGLGRDPAWEAAHHATPHVVYLAHSGGLKVGVTRRENVPARWIDQGAGAAIGIAQTPYRRLAGDIEVALKAVLSDRTAWNRMLTNADAGATDLLAEKARAIAAIPAPLAGYVTALDGVTVLEYPVLAYPAKVRGASLARQARVTGRLAGIRGQYLMFADGLVLNVRRHTGYEIRLSA